MQNKVLSNYDHDDLNVEECSRSTSTKENEYKLGHKYFLFSVAFRGRPTQPF